MDEIMKMQDNKVLSAEEEKEERADELWETEALDSYMPSNQAKGSAAGVLMMQSILCVILAIVMVICATFLPARFQEFRQGYQKAVTEPFDFAAAFVALKESLLQFMPLPAEGYPEPSIEDTETSIPVEEKIPENSSVHSENTALGAGGEENRIFSYNLFQNETLSTQNGPSFAPDFLTDRAVLPVSGVVSSPFGYREHPISGDPDFHKGTDIAAPAGTDIYAALEGTVITAQESSSLGLYIELSHGDGLITRYAHCSELIATVGTKVRQGEVIAKVGSTGNSTGNHLHFQITKDGAAVNPTWLFPELQDD
ncbi:MAG TPA: M23 family metallopeptidase [Firmicutes bacterium]|nr:M23 family metallopeptidase [Bacillota bacterium]